MLIDELIEARRSSGRSQRALGEEIGTDAQTIKRLERGIGSMETLAKATDALDFRLTGIGPGASLGDQLRRRRLKRSLSLERVSMRTGLSINTIRSLENDRGSVASLLRLLAFLAPGAKRRARERTYWGQGDKVDRDSRFTPSDFLEPINEVFGSIDLDPCAHRASPVVARRRILLEEGGDGLVDDWSGRFAFVNPPFSEQLRWLRRAHDQWKRRHVEMVACLVPAKTDSAWFHSVLAADADLYFLQGRVRFLNLAGESQPTPFSLMLATLGTNPEQRERYAALVSGFWMRRG